MSMNPTTRQNLVIQAANAHEILETQLSQLYTQISFYLDRFTGSTPAENFRIRDINDTIGMMSKLQPKLELAVSGWKRSIPSVDSSQGTQGTIAEIWINFYILCRWLETRGLDIDGIDMSAAHAAVVVLLRCNKHLNR